MGHIIFVAQQHSVQPFFKCELTIGEENIGRLFQQDKFLDTNYGIYIRHA